jgi:pyrroline-5-carboxylate reductase
MAEVLSEGFKVAIVGVGAMGGACLRGWLSGDVGVAKELDASNFVAVVRNAERRAALESELDVQCVADVAELPQCDLVVIAVKPQVLPSVLPGLAQTQLGPNALNGEGAYAGPLFVSLAAGVPCASISDGLAKAVEAEAAASPSASTSAGNNNEHLQAVEVTVVRVMPNMSLSVGDGASVVAGGQYATAVQVDLVCELFAALGYAAIVDESQIDAVCAISGGGPAYFALVAEVLAKAGVEAGLSADLAEALARQTLAGTGICLAQSDIALDELRRSVCSPGGTTLAAIAAMQEAGLVEALEQGVFGAIDRAKELAKC